MNGLMRRGGAWMWERIRTAPVTFVWLLILLFTTVLQHSMSPRHLNRVLGHHSTNIINLQTDPFQVLVTSLFWLDGAYWFPYLVLFCLFLVPAERWLGSVRFLVVGFSAHVIATYCSEGVLRWAIVDGIRSPRLLNVHDVGVSYFLAAGAAVLIYRFVWHWRWVYLAGLVVVVGSPLLAQVTFTAIGHACAALVGLAWYPITRGRSGKEWDPLVAVRIIWDALHSRFGSRARG